MNLRTVYRSIRHQVVGRSFVCQRRLSGLGSALRISDISRAEGIGRHVPNVMRANLAASLDKREQSFLSHAADVLLLRLLGVLVALLATNIRLIKFNRLAVAAGAYPRECDAP